MTTMRYLFFSLVLFGLLSCGSDATSGGTIAEVATGPNADIIRSPISAQAPKDTADLPKMTFLSEDCHRKWSINFFNNFLTLFR